MVHLKKFEGFEEYCYYWSVYNDPLKFKAQLKKIGCSDNIIKYLLNQIKLYEYDEDILFVGIDTQVYSVKWTVNNKGYNQKKFQYRGPVILTPEEIEEIEIEKNSNKYNL